MAHKEKPAFKLPGRLEKILASASVYYAQREKTVFQSVLVNSHCHVEEGTDYDNWDGGIDGHTVHLQVPTALYYKIVDDIQSFSTELCTRFNQFANVDGEYVSAVKLEIQDDVETQDWRENSGLLLTSADAAKRRFDDGAQSIWPPDSFRVFLSHKSEDKRAAAQLKEFLLDFGIACFVAHEDIEPTKTWQDEIEKALFSMDVLVALLTPKFSESKWTDQEIGVAIGRCVPVIPVRLGCDPYGFIGKYQALAGNIEDTFELAGQLCDLALTSPELKGRTIGALVAAFERSKTFLQANTLFLHIEKLSGITPELIERIRKACSANSQVRRAYKVQERLPALIERLKGEAKNGK